MKHLLYQVFRNYFYTGLSGLLELTVIFIMGVMLPRYLGQQLYGLYVFASAISGFVFGVAELGINAIITRELAKQSVDSLAGNPLFLSNALTLRIVLNSIAVTLIALGSLIFATDVLFRQLLLIMGVSYFVLNSTAVFVAALAGHMAFRKQLTITFTNRSLSCVFIAIALSNHSLIGVACALLLANIVTLPIARFLYEQEFGEVRLTAHFPLWMKVVRESYQVFLSNMASNFALRGDTILLGYYRGAAETGLYTAMYGVLLGVGSLSSAFISAIYPVMTKSNSQSLRQTRHLFWLLFSIYVVIGLLLLITINVFSIQIIQLLFGNEYEAGAIVLRILSLGMAVIILNRLATSTLVSVGQQRLSFYATLIGTGVNFSLNLLLIPSIGYIAASVTTFVGEAVVLAVALTSLNRYFSGRISKQGESYLLRTGEPVRTITEQNID